MILLTAVTVDFQALTPIIVVFSAFIGGITGAIGFTFRVEYSIKGLTQEIKRLRLDTENAVIHLEGLTSDMQSYLHEATKDNPNIKAYYIRKHASGHTGADFLKDK